MFTLLALSLEGLRNFRNPMALFKPSTFVGKISVRRAVDCVGALFAASGFASHRDTLRSSRDDARFCRGAFHGQTSSDQTQPDFSLYVAWFKGYTAKNRGA